MKDMKKAKSLLHALHVLHGDLAVCGWHFQDADTDPEKYKQRNQYLTHT
jgi:outer membrane lipopolysaccharide assembly protein LptE/RlpB